MLDQSVGLLSFLSVSWTAIPDRKRQRTHQLSLLLVHVEAARGQQHQHRHAQIEIPAVPASPHGSQAILDECMQLLAQVAVVVGIEIELHILALRTHSVVRVPVALDFSV